MAEITWGAAGQKTFHHSLDHGVLYVFNEYAMQTVAYPWNGLISIDETMADETLEALYYDGQKFLDAQESGTQEAELSVYTYPNAFAALIGEVSIKPGMIADGQNSGRFHLSYRVASGTDLNTNAGDDIHILFNVFASSSDRSRQTLGESASAEELTFSLYTVPDNVPGYAPTSHLVIHSSLMQPDLYAYVLTLLYGTSTTSAKIHTLPGFFDLVNNWNFVTVNDVGNGEWDLIVPDRLVTWYDSTEFDVSELTVTTINTDEYDISTVRGD